MLARRWSRAAVALAGLVVLLSLACSAPATAPAPAAPKTGQSGGAAGTQAPAAAAPTAAPAPLSLRVALSAPTAQDLGPWAAQESGIARRYGLELEVFSVGGGSRGLQILQSGEIDAMYVGLAPIVPARLGGADAVMIASTTNTIPFVMYSRPEIRSGADLRGGRVGISTFASESDISVNLALRELGLRREDVTVLQIGSPSERLAALANGGVQMVPLVPPTTLQADQMGMHRLIDLAERRVPWVFDGLVVRRTDVEGRADVVRRLLQAQLEGAYWARANPELGRRAIADLLKIEDPAVLELSYQEFLRLFVPDGRPSMEGARTVLEEMAASEPRVRDTQPSDYIDLRPLDAVQAAGFFDTLQRQYGP